jgi:hypothetical protein
MVSDLALHQARTQKKMAQEKALAAREGEWRPFTNRHSINMGGVSDNIDSGSFRAAEYLINTKKLR